MSELIIFEAKTDGAEWAITCRANASFKVTTSTQVASDLLVESFNKAFMIGMANTRDSVAQIVANMAAQLWPAEPENDENADIIPSEEVNIEDVENDEDVDVEPVTDPD